MSADGGSPSGNPNPTAAAAAAARACPFLDTINRAVIDFDMIKQCSVTLSPHHVYACLVCGKFFEGRGRHTHAFTHSVQAGHHVWINLTDGRVYCLPDMYEVVDASLADIKFALHPSFPPARIAAMDRDTRLSTDVSGVSYLPGFVGLNNLKHTDCINAIVQVLAHVAPLRNYFLDASNYAHVQGGVVQKFGDLVRRLWSPAAFKATASPIEFVSVVSSASKKRFGVGVVPDALELLTWLLNTLHEELTADYNPGATVAAAIGLGSSSGDGNSSSSSGGQKRPRTQASGGFARSIITDVFQGEVEVETLSSELAAELQAEEAKKTEDAKKRASEDAGGTHTPLQQPAIPTPAAAVLPSTRRLPFLFLSLDLPPTPLYKDDEGSRVIAQLPMYQLLAKYNGATVTDSLRGQYAERKRYRITRLPPFMILHLKRFSRNKFFNEKNPTIVNFPVKNLELRNYVSPEAAAGLEPGTSRPLPSPEALSGMASGELKTLLARLQGCRGAAAGPAPLEKPELLDAVRAEVTSATGTKYDLVANVCHDTPPASGTADPLASGRYRVHVQHSAAGQWYEIQDLHVSETLPQMIGLSESYLLVYRRQTYVAPIAFAAAVATGSAASTRGSSAHTSRTGALQSLPHGNS